MQKKKKEKEYKFLSNVRPVCIRFFCDLFLLLVSFILWFMQTASERELSLRFCSVFDVFFFFFFSLAHSTLALALVIFHYFHRRSKLSDFNDEIYWRIYLYMILEQSCNWNWNYNYSANWYCYPFNKGRAASGGARPINMLDMWQISWER